MSQALDESCRTCDKVRKLEQPNEDAHPCFKHSKEYCVLKLGGKRGWNPSECTVCIGMVNRTLSGSDEVRTNAQKNLDLLLGGVLSFANRVSSLITAQVPLHLSQVKAMRSFTFQIFCLICIRSCPPSTVVLSGTL